MTEKRNETWDVNATHAWLSWAPILGSTSETYNESVRIATTTAVAESYGYSPGMDVKPNFPTGGESNIENIMDPTSGPPGMTEMSLIKTVILSIMFLFSLVGNVATIVQMNRNRAKHSTIHTLILQLATADLIVTFFCTACEAIWSSTIQWYAGNFMCKGVKFLQVFGLYLSTYIIVIISVDRCCAILDPMSRNRAPRRVKIMIIVAWTLSALLSSPQAIMFSLQRGPFKEDFFQCVNFDFYHALWQEQLYFLATLLLLFVIPLMIMITCYALIFCTISRKSRDFESETNSTEDMLHGKVRSKLLHKAKTKSLKMTAVIVAVFVLCWSPYYIVYAVYTFVKDRGQLTQHLSLYIFSSGMSNSVVNPIIYGAFHMCRARKRRTVMYMQMLNVMKVVVHPWMHARNRENAYASTSSGIRSWALLGTFYSLIKTANSKYNSMDSRIKFERES
ncbi:gonadotropin-releasing hormone receptor-like isoform X2 [Lineus longissimus]|uniref:gonadotropin-releasing hormone receptor-like isoform X2 n=1 Tax=Lineus longissimus TaxID=88925 RepID=UPI00315C93CD